MAYPPTPPPDDRLNTTPQVTNHPSDHNLLSENIADIVNELGANPSGAAATVEARLDATVPIGTIFEFGGQSPPAGGWALCDGQSVSTTGTYADLFAIIGYNFGGAGSAFNLPDFRNRSAIGAATGGAGVGTEGGNIAVQEHNHPAGAHTHTTPNHNHSFSDDIANNVTRLSSWVDESNTIRVVISQSKAAFSNGYISRSVSSFINYGVALQTGLGARYATTTVSGTTGNKAPTTNAGTGNTGDFGPGADNYHPYTQVTKIIKY